MHARGELHIDLLSSASLKIVLFYVFSSSCCVFETIINKRFYCFVGNFSIYSWE